MPIAGKTKPAPGKAPVSAKSSAAPASAALNGKEARITVTKTFLQNGTMKGEPVVLDEQIEIKSFVTTTANVGGSVRYTRQLGNFESVQIGVDAHVPCYVEEMDDVFAQVSDKLKGKLEEFIGELQIAPSEPTEGEAEAGGEAEGTETAAEEGGVDIEYLKSASEDDLKELANGNDLGVNPDDYASEEDLRQVLIQAILGEEALQEYIGSQEGAGETGGDEAESQGYTEEELKGATADELKDIFVQWELGAYPKGPPNVAKNAAIKKILAAQAGT